jgi:ribosomal protein L12E/L44/L45/RPP1/RPP2
MTEGSEEERSAGHSHRGFNLEKLGFEITEKLLTKQPQTRGTDRQAHGEAKQGVQTKEQQKRKEEDIHADAGSGMFDNLGRDLVVRLLQQDEEARRLSLAQRRKQEEGQEALLKLGRNVIQHTTAVVENIENKELQRRNQEVGHTMPEGRDEERCSAGDWRADRGFNLGKLGFEITEKLLTKQSQPSGKDRHAPGEKTQDVQTKEQQKRKEEDIHAEAGSGMFDNLGRDLVGRLWQQDEEARRLSLVREAGLLEMQRRNHEEGQEALLKLGRNLIHHTTAVVENIENKSKNALPTQEDTSKGLPASLKELEQREFEEGHRSSLLDAFGRDLFQHTTAVVENIENTTKSVLPRRPSADECQVLGERANILVLIYYYTNVCVCVCVCV